MIKLGEAFIQHHDSSRCYNISPPPLSKAMSRVSKVPWVLPMSAENTTDCNRNFRIVAAQFLQYAAVILYGSESDFSLLSLSFTLARAKSLELLETESGRDYLYEIPVFFVDGESGLVLKGIARNDNPEDRYVVRLEKNVSWLESLATQNRRRRLDGPPAGYFLYILTSFCPSTYPTALSFVIYGLPIFVIFIILVGFGIYASVKNEEEETRRRRAQEKANHNHQNQNQQPAAVDQGRPSDGDYATLGISRNADFETARKAYHEP